MAQNQSLSTQEVADILHVSKSTIYDLIRRGEIHSYKIGRKVRFTQDDVDAYIARSRHEHSTAPVQRVDTHSVLLTPGETPATDLIISGQDVVLDILANFLHQEGIFAGRTYLSSFEGLLSLYEDRRTMLPGIPAVLINISYRTQGFYVQKGNPKSVRGWEDLSRQDVCILNRRPGSSARILLDVMLKQYGIPAASVRGYGEIKQSHLTMAAAVAAGEADIAIGTERISRQIDGIDFIPLLEERYDLVLKKDALETEPVKKLLEVLNSQAFHREIAHFSGNDYRDLGRIIEEV